MQLCLHSDNVHVFLFKLGWAPPGCVSQNSRRNGPLAIRVRNIVCVVNGFIIFRIWIDFGDISMYLLGSVVMTFPIYAQASHGTALEMNVTLKSERDRKNTIELLLSTKHM